VSHWFSGWKLQPDDEPGPVDEKYHQRAWLRPYRAGALRFFLSGVGVLLFFLPMYTAIIVLFNPDTVVSTRLLTAGSLVLIAIGLGGLVGRFFSTGVYVNDNGIRIVTVRRMISLPWTKIADVSNASGPVRLCGIPLIRMNGECVVVTTVDDGPVRTPMTSRSLDFLGRAESFDAAALAVERWWRDTR